METPVAHTLKPYSTLVDFVTGREVPNIGAEENRQAVEHFLVEQRGYAKEDIEVEAEIALEIRGEIYRSRLDLVVAADRRRFMVVKCAAGSLGSWERQTLAAARLLEHHPVPLAVVSDGKSAIVTDSLSGNVIGRDLAFIPVKSQALQRLRSLRLQPLPEERREREILIFRTYDQESVNVQRNVT